MKQAYFGKKLPTRTYVTEEESSPSGYKASKDRVTLMFCGNAYGDAKLKPLLVYRANNPRALKNCDKEQLPVVWRSNKKAWVTKTEFLDWFQNIFIPFVERYNKNQNLDNKALLILDNAPGHIRIIDDLCEHVKIMFLPPNTTSVVQPMDQGIIATFKAYYLRQTMRHLVDALSINNEDVTMYWKKYNIKDAITNIDHAWNEVTTTTMNRAWKNLWPDCVKGSEDIDHIDVCNSETIELVHTVGFEGVAVHDIHELLESHDEELGNEELLQLEHQSFVEEVTLLDESTAGTKHTRTEEQSDDKNKKVAEFIQTANRLKELVATVETDSKRINSFRQIIDGAMSYYNKPDDMNN